MGITQAAATTGTSRLLRAVLGVLLSCVGIVCLLRQTPARELSADPVSRLQEVRADILKRPAWPYDWMQLAVLLADQGQYGDELSEALRRTVQLGPNESALEYHRAVLALRHRQAPLPLAAAVILDRSLSAERRRHPSLIQAYVFLNYRDHNYCQLPDLALQERQWCVYLRNTRQRCRDRLIDRDAEAACTTIEQHYAALLSNWRFWVTTPNGGP